MILVLVDTETRLCLRVLLVDPEVKPCLRVLVDPEPRPCLRELLVEPGAKLCLMVLVVDPEACVSIELDDAEVITGLRGLLEGPESGPCFRVLFTEPKACPCFIEAVFCLLLVTIPEGDVIMGWVTTVGLLDPIGGCPKILNRFSLILLVV